MVSLHVPVCDFSDCKQLSVHSLICLSETTRQTFVLTKGLFRTAGFFSNEYYNSSSSWGHIEKAVETLEFPQCCYFVLHSERKKCHVSKVTVKLKKSAKFRIFMSRHKIKKIHCKLRKQSWNVSILQILFQPGAGLPSHDSRGSMGCPALLEVSCTPQMCFWAGNSAGLQKRKRRWAGSPSRQMTAVVAGRAREAGGVGTKPARDQGKHGTGGAARNRQWEAPWGRGQDDAGWAVHGLSEGQPRPGAGIWPCLERGQRLCMSLHSDRFQDRVGWPQSSCAELGPAVLQLFSAWVTVTSLRSAQLKERHLPPLSLSLYHKYCQNWVRSWASSIAESSTGIACAIDLNFFLNFLNELQGDKRKCRRKAMQ